MRFKTDWVTLITGSNFTVFALFCFVFEGNLPSTSPPPGGWRLYWEGRFNGGFFALPVRGAYIWRGLYMEGLIFGILRYVVVLLWFKPVLSTKRPRMQDYRKESKLERTH